ncbi:MAG: SusD/RagB family nutrient-binding outer membrane lipoprotein [bacterium]|nr:SusD/RagB family nutrient-binding outer membrane lipoprotein [bacterium]
MKKITYIVLATIVAISLTSCKKYLDDVKVNPNSPELVGPKVLLSSVEMATFASFTGNNARRSAVFVQQIAGTSFQMSDVQNYIVLESDVTNDWLTIYTGALQNAQLIIKDYGDGNPYYTGIAKVLMAMNLGLAADMWGDVPSKDAMGLGVSNLSPAYSSQQAVYGDIQTLLSEAITALKSDIKSNKLVPGAEDYIFNGSTSRWIQTAWVLKARYANRLSNKSASQSATDAITYLNSAYTAGFTGNSANAMAVFGPNGNESNQWNVFNQTRADYIKMGAFFISEMNSTSDPRLPLYADPVTGTVYVGGALTNPDPTTSSDIGDYCDLPDAPLPLVSYCEAKFIEAECKLRAGDAAGAATAHNAGVKASISAVTGGPDAAYEAAHATENGSSITLAKIMMEKYVALFTQVEVWTDWRRTKLPTLTPNPTANLTVIPKRLPTSVDERTYNKNAVVVSNIGAATWFE